jgi:hypothetical protein
MVREMAGVRVHKRTGTATAGGDGEVGGGGKSNCSAPTVENADPELRHHLVHRMHIDAAFIAYISRLHLSQHVQIPTVSCYFEAGIL